MSLRAVGGVGGAGDSLKWDYECCEVEAAECDNESGDQGCQGDTTG